MELTAAREAAEACEAVRQRRATREGAAVGCCCRLLLRACCSASKRGVALSWRPTSQRTCSTPTSCPHRRRWSASSSSSSSPWPSLEPSSSLSTSSAGSATTARQAAAWNTSGATLLASSRSSAAASSGGARVCSVGSEHDDRIVEGEADSNRRSCRCIDCDFCSSSNERRCRGDMIAPYTGPATARAIRRPERCTAGPRCWHQDPGAGTYRQP